MIANFYENNSLILTKKEIKILEEYFKNNLGKYSDWKVFSSPIINILNKSMPVMDYYKNQYDASKGLQCGKLLEIVIGDTLSRIFNTSYIAPNIFESNKYRISLTGEGGKGTGNTADIEILEKESGYVYIGEVKDEIARPGDCDLKYDENGHLYSSSRSTKWDEAWRPIIDNFNANTCTFDWFGHNYPISKHKEICVNITRNYFKNIDFLFTCKEDKLVTIPMNNFNAISSIFSFHGSEIRAAGKNTVKPFTKQYMKNAILNSEYFIEETADAYRMKIEVFPSLDCKGRNGGISSKYNFIPGFKVEKNKVTFDDNSECTILKSGILQLNPNISVHMAIKKSYNEIKKIFKED